MATETKTDVLYVGTYGPEDPTRATLVFAAAIGMRAKGAHVRVALLGQGVLLMNGKIAKSVCVVGQRAGEPAPRSIFDLMEEARNRGVEIHC